MEERNINVLLIEDNQDDAELLQRKLAKSVNGHFTVTPAKCLKDGLEKLSGNSHDLILSDLGLPDSHGLDTVTQVLQMAPDIPLVVLSGYDDEDVAIKAVQLGAQDYMVKGQMDGAQMERSLFYAVERFRLQRELEQHTQEISKIQANLLKILDKNADAIIVVSKDKQILFINPAAESLFKCDKKALLKTPFKYPVEGGKTSEIDIKHPHGEKTIADMRVVDIDWEGTPAYLASLRDITDKKKAGEKLRESEERLKKYLESAPDGVYISDTKGTLLYGNTKAEDLTGYNKEELIGTNFLKNKLLPTKYLAKAGKLLACSVVAKPIGPDEFELNRKDGSHIWVEINSTPIKQEGELLIIGFVRDITERKRAEALIQQQKEFLTNTFESLTHPFYVVDANNYRIQMANKAAKINSSSKAMTCYATVHNRDKPCSGKGNICPLEEVRISKKPVVLEHIHHNAKGKNRNIEVHGYPLFDAEGNVVQMIEYCLDITERKQAEDALRESEEKFSKAFRSSPDMIVITTVKDGTFVEVNDSFTENTGYTRKEVIGRRADELNIWVNKEDRLRMIGLLKEQGKVCQEEYEFRMKSGKIRLWLFSAEQINIGNEECIISITIDITERKEMEETLRFSDAAFKSIHESVIATDTNFTITHWNEISEQIYGIKASQATGKTLQNVIEIVEKYPGENEERFNNLNISGYLHEEQLHRTKHGEVWVDMSIQTIGGTEKRSGWVMLATAITQRKLAEEALKRSEEKYRELTTTSIDGIISMDRNMRIIIWNQGAERIFGYKEKEILGKPVVMLTPVKNRGKTGEILTKLFETNGKGDSSRIVEAQLVRKNGTVVPVEMSLSKRKVEENYLVTGIVRDITERKEAEEKLRQIDQMKSEFLSNVSHELRTPLQSIGGFAKLILEGKVPDVETQQEFLEIIDRESQQLGVLINSLLDMSRLESGRFQINKRLLPLRDTFIDSIKIFHSLARDKDVSLGEDIPETLPEIEVDAERLRQVIVNLMSNAIKFSDPGGRVTAKLATSNGELLFQVKDRGIGIDKKAMSHLFERFYRAEDKLARGGTGLGLFISKQIIEAHGGRIWAESKPGEGSTFSFTLPLNGKGGNGNGKKDTGN